MRRAIVGKEELELRVRKIEIGKHLDEKEERLFVIFDSSKYQQALDLRLTETNAKKFYVGETYQGIVDIQMSADFPRDDPRKMKVGTCCYIIKQLKDKTGKIIYQK